MNKIKNKENEMKVIKIDIFMRCPNCNNKLYHLQKYCDNCGIKLNWSEVKSNE